MLRHLKMQWSNAGAFFVHSLGNNFDPTMVDNPRFRMQVVEGLVSKTADSKLRARKWLAPVG